MGSFDNSQHQAKYSHVRRLASLNIYSRIINLASLGVGLRLSTSPQTLSWIRANSWIKMLFMFWAGAVQDEGRGQTGGWRWARGLEEREVAGALQCSMG